MDPAQGQFLQKQGFPRGIIQALQAQKVAFPLRVWILDNSAAMHVRDSHIMRGNYQNFDATRWEELQDCVAYHALFSATLTMPVRFALVNDPQLPGVPQYFSLNQTGNLPFEQQTLQRVMTQTRPYGPTLLTKQLVVLRDYITSIAPHLRSNNQTVSIILATQGLPTDEHNTSPPHVLHDFIQALRSFETLPVWLVIRLCTDDEKAFEFFNSIDAQLNLRCDVLDDFCGEAVELYLRNPWLTYGIPLHRFREMGFTIPVLDVLDERALTLHEIRDLCLFLFAIPSTSLPDPTIDWNGFLKMIWQATQMEPAQWNPVTKSATPWINVTMLEALYGKQHPPPSHGPPTPQQDWSARQSTSSSTQPAAQAPQAPQAPIGGKPQRPLAQPSPTPTVLAPTGTAPTVTPIQDLEKLKHAIHMNWAKQPPAFTVTKPIAELLRTVQSTFPLVQSHEYFQKFQPFSRDALASGSQDVLKRGTFYDSWIPWKIFT